MSLADRLPYVRSTDRRYVNQFDFVDRAIVFLYLSLAMFPVIYIMQENATQAELAELNEPVILGGSVLDILGWFLVFFMVWPVIRVLLVWSRRALTDASKRLYSRLREVV